MEGPLSSQDNAFEICKQFIREGEKAFSALSYYNKEKAAGRLFRMLSRYDDTRTLENIEGYEPGDTLMLIVPFLVEAGVTEQNLREVSARAGLVPGIKEWFEELRISGCSIRIISTSYEQHAYSIARRVRVPLNQVYCTKFPLDRFREEIGKKDLKLVNQVREEIVELYDDELDSRVNDEKIRKLLDPFFWKELPKTKLGKMMRKMKVMGGRRKVGALEEAIRASGGYLSNAFIVGDSITDFRMAQAVEAAGGIALAWNANKYMIPYASCGVAAIDARAVRLLFKAWLEGGRPAVRKKVEAMSKPEDSEKGPYYHWLAGKDQKYHEEVLVIHKRLRVKCRGKETAKLA